MRLSKGQVNRDGLGGFEISLMSRLLGEIVGSVILWGGFCEDKLLKFCIGSHVPINISLKYRFERPRECINGDIRTSELLGVFSLLCSPQESLPFPLFLD